MVTATKFVLSVPVDPIQKKFKAMENCLHKNKNKLHMFIRRRIYDNTMFVCVCVCVLHWASDNILFNFFKPNR